MFFDKRLKNASGRGLKMSVLMSIPSIWIFVVLIFLVGIIIILIIIAIKRSSQDESGDSGSISPIDNTNVPEPDSPWSFERITLWVNIVMLIISIRMISTRLLGLTWVPLCGVIIFGLHAWYTIKSLESVELGDQGVLLIYGKYIRDVKPGFVYIPCWPPGLCELVVETTSNIDDELPADPELIYHGDPVREGDGTIPDGKFAPIRITFAPPPPGNKPLTVTDENGVIITIPADDPYNRRLTAEVAMPFSWQITNLRKFIETIGTTEKAKRLMGDTAVAIFNSEFARMTPAQAMINLEKVSVMVKEALQKLMDDNDWGAKVVITRIKPFGFSHPLNEAVNNVPIAEQAAKSVIIASEGEMKASINKGIGDGDAEYERLAGRAEGEQELARIALTDAGRYAMLLTAAEKAASYKNFAVISGENNVIGGLLGLQAVANGLGMQNPIPIAPHTTTGTKNAPEPVVATPTPTQQPTSPRRERREKRRNKK